MKPVHTQLSMSLLKHTILTLPSFVFRLMYTGQNHEQQHELQHELQHESLYGKVLRLIQVKTSSTQELSKALGQKSISGQLYTTINKLKKDGLIVWTIPNTPKSSKQKYKITQKGSVFLQMLNSQ